jgi:hypothetical protein
MTRIVVSEYEFCVMIVCECADVCALQPTHDAVTRAFVDNEMRLVRYLDQATRMMIDVVALGDISAPVMTMAALVMQTLRYALDRITEEGKNATELCGECPENTWKRLITIKLLPR